MRASLLWLLLAAGVARAAPQVEIKAQTRLALDKVRLTSDGLAEVAGELVDKLTGEGLANQSVTITVGGQTLTTTTDNAGKFSVRAAVAPGPQKIELAFTGRGPLDRAELSATTDPSRAQVGLALASEEADAGAIITITGTADDAPIRLPVTLAWSPPTDPKHGGSAQVYSGQRFTLDRKRAGGPGPYHLTATFPGDAERQAARAELSLELTSATTTTVQPSAERLAWEDDLVVTGKVSDVDGQPIGMAAVTLLAGDKRLAQGVTREDGAYRLEVEGEVLGEGNFGIQVTAEPGKSFVRSSKSPQVIIHVAAPQPVPVSYTVIAFLATALAAGGFFAARTKFWRKWQRKPKPADAPIEVPRGGEPIDGGMVTGKPTLAATLRRPQDDGFAGVVRDTVRSRPVGEGVVRLLLGDLEREIRTAADGSFALERLEHGEWRAEVAAPGHVTETFVVSIPHRGELRGVRIDLVPVRERVFQLYRRAAEPVLPESRLWGIWSPRQIVDHVRTKRPSPALAELTDFVEEIYFSGRLAAEGVLPGTSERVDRAIRERAR